MLRRAEVTGVNLRAHLPVSISFLKFYYKIFVFIVCIFMSECGFVHMCSGQLEEGIRSPAAGVNSWL